MSATSVRSERRPLAIHGKRPTASQALPEPLRRVPVGRSQGKPAPVLPDYCEPYHCDPPRPSPTEPLLRALHREVLLGTW